MRRLQPDPLVLEEVRSPCSEDDFVRRRLAWSAVAEQGLRVEKAAVAYQNGFGLAVSALQRSPLATPPRTCLVRLDFVPRELALTQTLLEDLGRFASF